MNTKQISIKKIAEALAAALIILGVFVTGFWIGQQTKQNPMAAIYGLLNVETEKPGEVDFSQFWQAWGTIRSKYVDRAKLDNQEMVYGAISGLVRSLDDPYSVFLKPPEAKTFAEDVEGQFSGIGIEIGAKEGGLTIIAPLENTPAQRAGLKAGDKILKIDQTESVDMTTEEAVHLIRGPVGTTVTLSIMREGWTEPQDFRVVREVISIPTISWKLVNNDIAHIRIYSFTSQTENEFSKAVNEILATPARAIILDLRNDPGGYLDQAVGIAGWFLQKGEVVLMEDEGFGPKICETCRASGNSRLANFPMTILVNKGSASASEILAGALRDDKGTKLVGETTFGKGSVQTLDAFDDGSSLKITIAKWLTPKGVSITKQGLVPDVAVTLTDEDLKANRDPQLDKAVELLAK